MAKKPKTDAPGIGHNSEALEVSIHQFMEIFHEQRAIIADAQAALKAVKKRFKEVRNAAKLAGHTLHLLDEACDIEDKNDRDTAKEAAERRFIWEIRALPQGLENGELFGDAKTREADYWSNQGYNAGLNGLPAKAPDGLSGEHLQIWLKRHAAGAERLAWARATNSNPERMGSGLGPTAAEIAREADPLLT